jgi:hypothetical protein
MFEVHKGPVLCHKEDGEKMLVRLNERSSVCPLPIGHEDKVGAGGLLLVHSRLQKRTSNLRRDSVHVKDLVSLPLGLMGSIVETAEHATVHSGRNPRDVNVYGAAAEGVLFVHRSARRETPKVVVAGADIG